MKKKLRLSTLLVVIMLTVIATVVVAFSAALVLLTRQDLNARLDESLRQVAVRSAEFASRGRGQGGGGQVAMHNPLETPGQPLVLLSVYQSNGEVLFGAWRDGDGEEQDLSAGDLRMLKAQGLLTAQPTTAGSVPAASRLMTVALSIGKFRVTSITPVGRVAGASNVVVIGIPTDSVDEAMERLMITVGCGGLAALLIAWVLGDFLIRRALRPLSQVSAAAKNVAAMPLASGEVELSTARLPESLTHVGTEVGDVGAALNHLLDTMQAAFSARQASEMKLRTFVADASHELRTPLTAIRGYADMLKVTEELSESGETSLARVESQSMRMSALVEDLLLLARLDAGRVPERKPLDLNEVVVEGVLDANATGPEHTWNVTVPDEPLVVLADRAQLIQMITNLLSNARKHTPAGTVVTAQLTRVDAASFPQLSLPAEQWAHLTISDNGPGIPADFLPKLFDRFSRRDISRKAAIEGSTGLGMAITKAIMDTLGGRIVVQSDTSADKHHTTFTLLIPVHTDVSG